MLHTHGFVIWWRVSESFRGRQQSDRRPRERGETHTPRPRVWHGGLTASAQANICGYGSLRSQRRRGPSCYRTLAFQIAAPRAKHTFAISRHDAPELCNSLSPQQKGAGNAGRPLRPQPCVQNEEAHKHSHHGHTGLARHSPRNGFNGFLRALAGDRACLPPSPARSSPYELDASVGASRPHDFAVRKKRPRQMRHMRPPHPAPRS